MAPNMSQAHCDLVLPPLLVGEDDYRSIAHDHVDPSPPYSPVSMFTPVPINGGDSEAKSPFESISADKKNICSRRLKGSCSSITNSNNNENNNYARNNTKRVRFHSRVRFKHVKHIDNYTDKQYSNTWFLEEELQEIFDHCVETVTKMISGCPLEESKGYCSRGLEYKTPTGAKTRKQNKTKGWQVVLDEQERQRCLGISDPERISKLYHRIGADSRRAYRLLGIKDQTIIQADSSSLDNQQKKKDSDVTANSETLHDSATSVVEEFSQAFQNVNSISDQEQ
jgi:hypothetical protein